MPTLQLLSINARVTFKKKSLSSPKSLKKASRLLPNFLSFRERAYSKGHLSEGITFQVTPLMYKYIDYGKYYSLQTLSIAKTTIE